MNCFINRHVLDGDWRSQHCHLVRWWNTVLHQVKLSEVGLLRLFVFSCCSNPIMFLCFLDILVCLVRLPLVMRSQRFEVLGGWLDEYGWILPNLPPLNKVMCWTLCSQTHFAKLSRGKEKSLSCCLGSYCKLLSECCFLLQNASMLFISWVDKQRCHEPEPRHQCQSVTCETR